MILITYNGFMDKQISEIGKIIKSRLKEMKKTQGWLAEKVDVSNVAVTKWIKFGNISRENVKEVSLALEMTVDELLGGDVDYVANELERQLLMFYRGMDDTHKDDIIMFANRLYSIDNDGDILANPLKEKENHD